MGLLFSKPKPAWPATVPTDTIIPGHYWDSQPIMRAYCIDLTFRFDDVLDTDKMRAALARLLEIGDWRKLGARIRLNVRFLYLSIDNNIFFPPVLSKLINVLVRRPESWNTMFLKSMTKSVPASCSPPPNTT